MAMAVDAPPPPPPPFAMLHSYDGRTSWLWRWVAPLLLLLLPSVLAAPLPHRIALLRSQSVLHPRLFLGGAFPRSRARALSFARRSLTIHSFESPLSIDPSLGGEYIMNLTLGTPPQSFSAFADTGSTLVWLQCTPCKACSDPHSPIFHQHRSSSYKPLPCHNAFCKQVNALNFSRSFPPLPKCSKTCQYEYAYGGNSTTVGELASETVTLNRVGGGTTAVLDFAFGCAHHTSGSLDTAGVVGLDRGPYSFISQLGDHFGHAFSYCLVGQELTIVNTSLLFLGSSEFLRESGAKYTPLVVNKVRKANAFYYVRLLGITLGGKRVQVSSRVFEITEEGRGGVIFDSGTTAMVLAEPAFKALLKALRAAVSYPEIVLGGDLEGLICYNTSGLKKNPRFPSFTLNFVNADFKLPAENVYAKVDSSTICVAVLSGAFINPDLGALTIIGNLVQQNFHIMYDLKHNQLGFVQRRCRDL